MKNIFTLGNGFVGQHLNYPIIKDRVELSTSHIEKIIDAYKPNVLINAIGFCGHPNIDQCESQKEKTALLNTALPILLAEVCNKKSIKLIHISSGCIHYSSSPNQEWTPLGWKDNGWREKDIPDVKLMSTYSKSKYTADLMIADLPNVLSLRIRMPISNRDHQRNFINKLLNYKRIIDIPNSATFLDDFVRCVDWAIEKDLNGIYNVVNPDPITAAQVIKAYQAYVPSHSFEVINERQLNQLTIARRSNCILNTDKLNQAGFIMRPTKEALEKCMKEFANNI